MTKITQIGSKNSIYELKNNNFSSNDTPEIFPSDNKRRLYGPIIEKEDLTPEIDKAFRFLHIISNDAILNDDTLLAELEDIKSSKINLKIMLDNFRLNSGDFGGLLDTLEEFSNSNIIKKSTVDKYKKYFTEVLEKDFGFDRKYKSVNEELNFKYKKYSYKSDKYNVIQKDENILEIENLTTKEKRTIDFRKILPTEINGIQDIISLKSSIQKLPAEILFQIPEEISLILSREALADMTIELDKKTGEFKSDVDDIEGRVDVYEGGVEAMTTNSFDDTLIHEIAHAIFIDKDGNDALEKNTKLVELFNKGSEKFKKDNNYFSDKDGYTEEGYWSENISELGAEIINAVFTNNTIILDSIEKYAPGAIEIVLNEYKNRLGANDRHNKIDIDTFLDFLETVEDEPGNTTQ